MCSTPLILNRNNPTLPDGIDCSSKNVHMSLLHFCPNLFGSLNTLARSMMLRIHEFSPYLSRYSRLSYVNIINLIHNNSRFKCICICALQTYILYIQLYIITLDIAKGFDRVWHTDFLNKLPSYVLPPNFWQWNSTFCSGRSVRLCWCTPGFSTCSNPLSVRS